MIIEENLQEAVLCAVPQAKEIIEAVSYRPGYMPYPARITLKTAEGTRMKCVLKVSPHHLAEREAQILRFLANLHQPVPAVLAGPVAVDHNNQATAILLLSELPGHPLPWISLFDLNQAHLTCRLLPLAVDALHSLTPSVQAHKVSALLPSITLESELQTVMGRDGPWMNSPLFLEAVPLLQSNIRKYTFPLVFSNGDYNPLNFLVVDRQVTGWLDFENACFEDPYIGFAKFILWADDEIGWSAGVKCGLVERYLFEHNVLPEAFLFRLVLRGLRHIQESDPYQPPEYMLGVVGNTLDRLKDMLKKE